MKALIKKNNIPRSQIADCGSYSRHTDGYDEWATDSGTARRFIWFNNTNYSIFDEISEEAKNHAIKIATVFGYTLYDFPGERYNYAPSQGWGPAMYVAVLAEK